MWVDNRRKGAFFDFTFKPLKTHHSLPADTGTCGSPAVLLRPVCVCWSATLSHLVLPLTSCQLQRGELSIHDSSQDFQKVQSFLERQNIFDCHNWPFSPSAHAPSRQCWRIQVCDRTWQKARQCAGALRLSENSTSSSSIPSCTWPF